jgi:tRNA(Ile)-lysidine synthase
MDLLDCVRTTLRRHDLARADTRVLLALSGGPDSVALAWLLHALQTAGELRLAGLAHVNHQLRDDAAADEAFCVELADTLGLPCDVTVVDVRALAARDGTSVEAAAHDARHHALRAAAGRLGAGRVALGHTLDDQAETVLLRLLRGAGSKGLAGMHPRNGPFIRPLLDLRRHLLSAFLAAAGHAFRIDTSNDDRRIPRNRIRAELLPWLAREFNPRITEVLGMEAELAREDWRFLESAANALLQDAATEGPGGWRLAASQFASAPKAVARAAIRRLMERSSGGRPIGLRHVDRALDLCLAPSGSLDLPGHRMERIRDAVVLTSRGANPGRGQGPAGERCVYTHSLAVPGETPIPEAGCAVLAELAGSSVGLDSLRAGRGDTAVAALDRCPGPLAVRSRRPGDRLSLPGLTGHKKLQDLFVDRKVPRDQRDRVPLVVDCHDRIVWVPGQAVASEFRVTDPAQAVIILRLKVRGGSA